MTLAPFPSEPERTYVFQYTRVQVPGTVWDFDQNGEYIDFGGPVGLIDTSFTTAVSIGGVGIVLDDASDVAQTNAKEIRGYINAAERYCGLIGKTRQTSGASIFAKDGNLFLDQFCE